RCELRVGGGRGVVVCAPGPGAGKAGGDRRAPAGPPGEPAAARRAPAVLPKESFAWLEAEQTYVCPAGHRLGGESRGREGREGGEQAGYRQYRRPPRDCREGPLAPTCPNAPEEGRPINPGDEEELVAALRQRMSEPSGQERYRLRKQTVELGYAEFKAHRGLTRFHSFGLERAQAQIGLLVLMHNGKVMVKALDKPGRTDVTSRNEAA